MSLVIIYVFDNMHAFMCMRVCVYNVLFILEKESIWIMQYVLGLKV